MPKDPAGVEQMYGIDGVGKPGSSIGPEGFEESNLEKPSMDLPKNEISDEKGPTSGPKD